MKREQKFEGLPEPPEPEELRKLEMLDQFFTETKAYQELEGREAWAEILAATPGTDPVLAIAEGQSEVIPTSGWLVAAKVTPGYGGVVQIIRYPEGSFEVGSLSDDREKYGSARVHYNLKGYARHVMAYENPNYPTKDVEPHNRMTPESYAGMSFANTDIVPLENGGRLLDESRQMIMVGGRMSEAMDYKPPDGKTVTVNRAVSGIEEAGAVLVQLGAGMGLEQNDTKTLLESVAQKVGHLA